MPNPASYYTDLAETESANGPAGFRRLDGERAHLLRVLDGCVQREMWSAANRLVAVLTDQRSFLRMQGYMTDLVTAIEAGLKIAQGLGNRQHEGAHLGNLGLAYSDLGEVEKAIGYYEQALAISREIGYRQGEGSHLGNLGLAYSDLGEVDKARGCWQESLAIFEAIKSPYAEQARQLLAGLDGAG